MSDMNIYQRINQVMKEVAYIKKDAKVQGYSAVTHDNVTAVLRPHMVEHGIMVLVDQKAGRIIEPRNPERGIKMHLYQGEYSVSLVNIDSPEDRVTVNVQAHANDNGDKAPGKAMSYAVKYAMLKTFSLETGENDEQRFADPYTPEQAAVYHDLLDNDKAYEFYLFVATLPPETVIGLVNSFPDGKKSQGKKKAAALEKEGVAQFIGVVEDVQARLAEHDISVTEITDEMSAVEKKLLASRLSAYEVEQLTKIKKSEKAR